MGGEDGSRDGRAQRRVTLDDDVADAFPDDASVNEALRLVARLRQVGRAPVKASRPRLALAPPAARLPAGPAPCDEARFLQPAQPEDVGAIVHVRNAAATALTARFGTGEWSHPANEADVATAMKTSIVLVAKDGVAGDAGEPRPIIATLRLGTRKPWIVEPGAFQPRSGLRPFLGPAPSHPSSSLVPRLDDGYGRFTACSRPVYLHDMVVAPSHQGGGLGRRCIDDAVACARDMQGGAIRVGVLEGDAGAAAFLVRCGFVEVARAERRGVGWVYLERAV